MNTENNEFMPVPKVNADLIRTMSIDQLAELMLSFDDKPCPPTSHDHCTNAEPTARMQQAHSGVSFCGFPPADASHSWDSMFLCILLSSTHYTGCRDERDI